MAKDAQPQAVTKSIDALSSCKHTQLSIPFNLCEVASFYLLATVLECRELRGYETNSLLGSYEPAPQEVSAPARKMLATSSEGLHLWRKMHSLRLL